MEAARNQPMRGLTPLLLYIAGSHSRPMLAINLTLKQVYLIGAQTYGCVLLQWIQSKSKYLKFNNATGDLSESFIFPQILLEVISWDPTPSLLLCLQNLTPDQVDVVCVAGSSIPHGVFKGKWAFGWLLGGGSFVGMSGIFRLS